MFDWALFLKIIIAVIQAIFQNLPPMRSGKPGQKISRF